MTKLERKMLIKPTRKRTHQNYLNTCKLKGLVSNRQCFDHWITLMMDRYPTPQDCRKVNWKVK